MYYVPSLEKKNTSALLLVKDSSRAGRGALAGLEKAVSVAEHIFLLFSDPGTQLLGPAA